MKRYDSYKDSGMEWIGEIPEGWEVYSLKHCVETRITDGPHETPEFILEGIPFVSAEAVQDGAINFDSIRGYISVADDKRFSLKCKPRKHDIFIVKSGSTTGKIGYVDSDINFNIWSPLALVRASNNNSSKYLYHFLQSDLFQTQVQLSWSFGTQPNIGMNVIENLKIIVPPRPEQTAIARFLDRKTTEIDQLIANKEKLIALYEEEKTAIINRAVTRGLDPTVKTKPSGVDWLGDIPEHWEVKRLKYVANMKSGEGITSDQIKESGDYPVYGGNGLRGYFDSFTHEGDYALIGRQGALCGNINYASGKFWASEHAIVCTLAGNHKVKWFGELLKTMNLNQYSVSAAQPGLSVENIKVLQVPVPPPSEQTAIVTHIETECSRLDTIIDKFKKQIELFKEYRTTLISEVVTGKIDVHGEATL